MSGVMSSFRLREVGVAVVLQPLAGLARRSLEGRKKMLGFSHAHNHVPAEEQLLSVNVAAELGL